MKIIIKDIAGNIVIEANKIDSELETKTNAINKRVVLSYQIFYKENTLVENIHDFEGSRDFIEEINIIIS